MNLEETAHILGSMQQAGAKVNTAPATVQIWQRALAKYPKDLVSEIVQDYMGREEREPRPAAIRKLCDNAWERKLREESRMLLRNDPLKMTFTEWKKLHPGEAYRLYEEGRREYALSVGVEYVPLPRPPVWCESDVSVLANTDTDLNL